MHIQPITGVAHAQATGHIRPLGSVRERSDTARAFAWFITTPRAPGVINVHYLIIMSACEKQTKKTKRKTPTHLENDSAFAVRAGSVEAAEGRWLERENSVRQRL